MSPAIIVPEVVERTSVVMSWPTRTVPTMFVRRSCWSDCVAALKRKYAISPYQSPCTWFGPSSTPKTCRSNPKKKFAARRRKNPATS